MKIRDLHKNDAERMLEWMQNPDIADNFRFEPSNIDISTTTSFIEASLNNTSSQHYAVTDDEDRYMGTVSLKNIDFENKNAEYAISLHMDAIGKGYAKFATNAILDIAFNKLKLNRVYLNVLSKNIRAIKFYEKYGFIFEGESKEHLFHKGNFESLRWYRILASEKEAMDKS
ncbi:MAG: GNAT family N-acetyltransferase [Methanocorpusculum parvum]|nr:GNAT family N-acetyltransferase [Methanocorpusculum parvum]